MGLSWCYMIMFMSGIWNYKHIMMSLLWLQFIILSLFYFTLLLLFMMTDLYMLIIFLTFSVCEGLNLLGLSCLVTLIRSHGNDNLLSINLLMC